MSRRDVRAEILVAAEALAIEKGFGGVTTKEVAKAAGCSEGSIYNHFSDRNDLLSQVVAGRMLLVFDELADASLEVGADGSLDQLVRGLLSAYGQLIALSTSLFADPDVLARFNAVLEDRGASPEGIRDAVAKQIRDAQERGVLRADVGADAVAFLLTGSCHEAALHAHLGGHPMDPEVAVRAVAGTLGVLLKPPG